MKINQKSHISKLLDKGFRFDKRKFEDFRKIIIEKGVSKNTEGSARVKFGDTEVISGVKVALDEPYPDTPDKGNISVNIELLALSSPNFEPGPPSIKAIEMSRVVDRGLRESGVIDFKKLCIEKGKRVWTLLIDICTINDAGNLLDASSLAALAALQDLRFPAIKEDGTLDYKTKTDKGLELKDKPIEVTIYKIGKNLLVDPSLDEEESIDSRLTVASLADGSICALQKGEAGALSDEDINQMIDLAVKKAQELREMV